ncbi:alpha/beta fold hydrolase [Streptomyces sp. DSM 118878]
MTLLHAHEFGGVGPQLVLLHGFGRSLADWETAAAPLTTDHRVLGLDLPGHGRSPDVSPWTMSTAVQLIADTLDAHGVSDAVIVGHSLGGMTAVEYAREHPDQTRAAVNLDGFWWSPEYPGAERVNEGLLAMAGSVAPAGYVEQKVTDAARLGIPADHAEAAARAAARPLPDGTWQTLPERTAARQLVDELHGIGALGVTKWLDGIERPLLLARADRRLPSAPGMEWFSEFNTRFAQEVRDELAVLARTRPTVTVAGVEATHIMHMEAPDAVATLVTEYVRGLP